MVDRPWDHDMAMAIGAALRESAKGKRFKLDQGSGERDCEVVEVRDGYKPLVKLLDNGVHTVVDAIRLRPWMQKMQPDPGPTTRDQPRTSGEPIVTDTDGAQLAALGKRFEDRHSASCGVYDGVGCTLEAGCDAYKELVTDIARAHEPAPASAPALTLEGQSAPLVVALAESVHVSKPIPAPKVYNETQLRLIARCDEIKEMLLAKNAAYGNSAIEPRDFLCKLPAQERIKVRIDDKLNRLVQGEAAGEDVQVDLAGYFILWSVIRDMEAGRGFVVPEGYDLAEESR